MNKKSDYEATVFSGMYSLIFKSSKGTSNLQLPNIFMEEVSEVKEAESQKEDKKNSKKKRSRKSPKMKVTACPHYNNRHYAKNMCNSCYHKSGRDKKAWTCPHQDRSLYAKGMCQLCYLRSYHRARICKPINTEDLAI
ncbi:unnamed protein product [Blepharisma stoltei]|uniref:Uncharacterized protein n=1 Tax=Blepharisma stoltei TaxID=1481888 RepID=A0AAU9KB46_9CILI|nr:unnamed protein product [Blepharisma stoltei]